MNEKNGWTVIGKGGWGVGSKYKKYESLLVVVLAEGKNGFLYLMPKVMETIDNPPCVQVASRGSNLALIPSNDGGYRVQKDKGGQYSLIQIKKICKSFNLRPGAYQCHVENGNMVVFDTADTPSKP